MVSDFLPYTRPDIGEGEIELVIETLKSGWLTSGPVAGRFEAALTEYAGTQAIVCASNTMGMFAVLHALGVKPGDEVIMPSYTFAACAQVVLLLGATPVFIDCGSDFNMTASSVKEAIGPRTRVVMVVHIGGLPVDVREIRNVTPQGIFILEDAAHALGSSTDEVVGHCSYSDACVYSFYATKNITTGDGGAVLTPHRWLAERVRAFLGHGMDKAFASRYSPQGNHDYLVLSLGFKGGLPDPLAAIGLVQLSRLKNFLHRRYHLAQLYFHLLEDDQRFVLPHQHPGHGWHLFMLQVLTDRMKVISHLRQRGVGTSVHFKPLHLQPAFFNRARIMGAMATSEMLYEREISLPLYPLMTDTDVHRVVAALKDIEL